MGNEVEWLLQAPRMIPDGVQDCLVIGIGPIMGTKEGGQLQINSERIMYGLSLHVESHKGSERIQLRVSRS
jgi:hypothetical protein